MKISLFVLQKKKQIEKKNALWQITLLRNMKMLI